MKKTYQQPSTAIIPVTIPHSILANSKLIQVEQYDKSHDDYYTTVGDNED
jgi:hypothetical protein